jgi:hypothetical protein
MRSFVKSLPILVCLALVGFLFTGHTSWATDHINLQLPGKLVTNAPGNIAVLSKGQVVALYWSEGDVGPELRLLRYDPGTHHKDLLTIATLTGASAVKMQDLRVLENGAKLFFSFTRDSGSMWYGLADLSSFALLSSQEITNPSFSGRNLVSLKDLHGLLDVVSLGSTDQPPTMILSSLTLNGHISAQRNISLPAFPGAIANLSDSKHLWFVPSGSIRRAFGARVLGVGLNADQQASTITLPRGQTVVGLLGVDDGVIMAVDDGIPTNARGSMLQIFDPMGRKIGQSETVTACEFASPFVSTTDPSMVGVRCTHLKRGAFDNYRLTVDDLYVFQRKPDGDLKTVESFPIDLRGQLLGASFGRDDSGHSLYALIEEGGQLSVYVR